VYLHDQIVIMDQRACSRKPKTPAQLRPDSYEAEVL
jgi:hypothetical protein